MATQSRKIRATQAGNAAVMTTTSGPARSRIRHFASLPATAVSLALLAAPSPAVANEIARRTANLVVYGNDPCPPSTGDDIVVCAHRPENERYRIPKELRAKERGSGPASRSWASHWDGVEDATRYTRPDSCSPVGTWGQTGCLQSMLRRWWDERHSGSSAP
jgi:hypothetical protein